MPKEFKQGVYILKANGTRELFLRDKLLGSLTCAGAEREVAEKIVHHIEGEIEDGMSSERIYNHAFELLHKFERPSALRYSLRRAIAELGPSGFPFEKFFAELMKHRGFETATNQIVQGHCTDHEIDVVAWNDQKLIMAEAKFHNQFGLKSDVKVALYVKSRFDDLHSEEFNYGRRRKVDDFWLVKNTKFTKKAIQYAECAGVRLIGWNYPREANFHHIIEDEGLHPLTSLTTLSVGEKRTLMERGVVLCKSVRDNAGILESIGLKGDAVSRVVSESNELCPLE